MHKALYSLAALFSALPLWAAAPVITSAGGSLESAYAEWQPVSGAQSYHVYYTGSGASEQRIDAPLVRSYGSYVRADVPGLAAGTYTLRVVPVINGAEAQAATTGNLSVLPHDRTGFSFSNGRVPGAYQANGKPKA